MIAPLRLLLVEDSPLDARLIIQELKQAGLPCGAVIQVDTAEDLVGPLRMAARVLVISDYHLPQMNGLQARSNPGSTHWPPPGFRTGCARAAAVL